MREKTASCSVGVVGAGIAGLSAAHALNRAGFAVTVFERAPALRATGGALILWSNALSSLARLGLRARLLSLASTQAVEQADFRNHKGRLLTTVPIGEMARRHKAETVVVARADLIELLAEDVTCIRFGQDIREFINAENSVVTRLNDGKEEVFALLVGADGLHSTVREALGLHQPIRSVQQDMWVGTADWRSKQIVAGVVTATIGTDRRFWYTLLGDGRVFWYATLRSSDGVSNLADLGALFSAWHAPIPDVIGQTRPADAKHTSIMDREPSPVWGAGRVTLIGDSAHAMTPDIGQGACQAIESAVVLAERMRAEPNLTTAVRHYERQRYARTADVNRLSWLVARTSPVSSLTSLWLRDAAIRIGLRRTFMTQLDWLFTGP